MSTGYTADVQDGKITELKDFVMQCARAFGALVTMRDDPPGTEIPEKIEPSNYHSSWLAESKDKLKRLQHMEAFEITREAKDDFAARMKAWQDREEEKMIHRKRYESMLAKVQGWNPPTPEHVGLKKFMEEQLTGSIDFDCQPSDLPAAMSPAEWHTKAVADANWHVEYHAKQLANDQRLADDRTEWIQALRTSLK